MLFYAKKNNKRKLIAATIALFIVACFLCWRIFSVIHDISSARAKYITTLEINAVTSQYLAQCAEIYDGILIKDKSSDGKITAINTDVSKINHMQTEITRELLNRLGEEGVYEITLPLANIFGINMLTATGPRVKMSLSPASNVTARFEDSFTSAGINQTKFSVNLIIEADVTVSVSPFKNKVHVCHSLPVVQLILVGKVPETYADISR